MSRYVAAIAAAALLVAACTSGSEAPQQGLLAVVDGDGQIGLITIEGETIATLTEIDGSATVFQPVWSGPENLVFVEQSGFGGAVVVATIEGEQLRRVEFVTPPFFLYPRPGTNDGDIVTLRSDLDGSLAAEILHADESVGTLEGGFPFFLTWMPDGRLVAHVGNAALKEVYPDTRAAAVVPGPFGAPAAWGDSVVYIRAAGSTSFLSVLSGEQSIDLATVGGPTHLVVGGDRVAVRSVGGVMPAGGIEILARQVPLLPAEALVVVGLDDGVVETVARGGIAAFFWDPTGRRLLYLDLFDEASSRLAWHVWEDGQVVDFPPFIPDPTWWVSFAPFFDQYAQSMTLWSPDSSAFAYPGRVGDETGVWVQHLDQPAPVRVSSGSWVAWSPGG